MRRHSLWLPVFFAVLSGSLTSRADAQELKPYFLVIVDTSSSMTACAGGSADTTCNGKINRCNFPQNKIGDAKCALQRIVDGTGGDATFGLMQFAHPCVSGCGNTAGATCGGAEQACTATCGDAQLAVAIASGNASLMREWVDGTCQGSCGGLNYPHEITTGQWTPLGISLSRANQYLRGIQNSSQYNNALPNITGTSTVPPSPIENDPQLACRPVSVILLTDGVDTCSPGTEAPARAMTLFTGDLNGTTPATKKFRTYVIGFGSGTAGGYDPNALGQIATSGGTNTFFPASDEASLSLALNKIVADAQPPVEVCNNLDDDCDIKIDEGLPKFCNKPMGINDKTLCDEPNETNCDGEDDDCDGVIDEGLTNACGECGALKPEVCDGVDNDCDSRVDEGTDTLMSCGSDKGECEPGKLSCTMGVEQCQGEIGPMPEQCDCKDNDCDGNIDEQGTEKLCPANQRCAANCQCVEFCQQTDEFAAGCGPGLAPEFQTNGECLCIVDLCDHQTCPKQTMEKDSDVICAPGSATVAACTCKAGACVSVCSGVTCSSGQTCNPKSGRCVEDNCRGLGCPASEICDPVEARCVKDECASTQCSGEQVCRGGKCETSCATVACAIGERCTSGNCIADKCASVVCEPPQVCDEETGECGDDRCVGVNCGAGQTCSAVTGKCEALACWNVKCPSNQTCAAGECKSNDGNQPPPKPPTAGRDEDPGNRLLATGGGGCACSVPGGTGGMGTGTMPVRSGWLLLIGLSAIALRVGRRGARRRELQALGLVMLGAALIALAGCKVSPLCTNCIDAAADASQEAGPEQPPTGDGSAANGGNGGGGGASGSGGDGPSDGGGVPSEGGMKCVPAGEETCNDKDDDCDFKVDEDVVPTTNSCNQTGVCAGAVPVCTGGNFVCRYPATFETTESLCDGVDNDCDSRVDESFETLGMPCDLGIGACKVTGNLKCNAAHTGLSCEIKDTIAPGDEVCNGKDDDCDGMIDEPKATPGSNPSYVQDDVVKVSDTLWVYKYEASRVDADSGNAGIVTTRTCSRANVLPWTNVTYGEALAACQTVGMKLCALNDWTTACKAGPAACNWGAATSCGATYTAGDCNGHDETATPGSADHDAIKPTGNKPKCFADFAAAGQVFDLSGNAKEWTVGDSSPGANPLRGGSYNNNAQALRCDFDYTLGDQMLRLPNVGFRCCSNSQP